jgi:YbbR domain-containing protein
MTIHPFRNLGLKAVALVLASVLWFAVSRDSLVERSLRVPLEFQNMPEGLEIVGEAPATVDVRVRGASGLLSRLETGEVVSVLDLRGARPGTRLFHLLTDEVRAPFGLQVTQVSPPTVSLEFERAAIKIVPVVPAVEGEPAPGYVAGRITAEPSAIEVVGPESRLGLLDEATTEPVSIQNATRRVRETVTVGVADSSLRVRSARAATVTVDIEPAPVEREVPGVAVSFRGLGRGHVARVQPTVVKVVLRGRREAVAAAQADYIRAFVDLSSLGPGRYVVPVKAESAGEFGVVRTDPLTVEVRIR